MANRFYTAAFFSSSIAEQARFPAEHLEVHPCGVRLSTRWDLHPGTEIELGVSCGKDCRSVRGVVVDCECLDRRASLFDVTMFFVEAPCQEFQALLNSCDPDELGSEE